MKQGFTKASKDKETLTSRMSIEPAGTAMIAIQISEPHRRMTFGDDCAYITVYNVSFTPDCPEDAQRLCQKVNEALAEVEKQPYDFYEAEKYNSQRPYVRRRNVGRIAADGRVNLVRDIDLDDLWRLYEVMGAAIKPSQQIAQAMYRASLIEARGPIMDIHDPLGGAWTKEYEYTEAPGLKVGNYAELAPSEYFSRFLSDSARMLATADQDEESQRDAQQDLINQMIVMAQYTLIGALPAPQDRFPTMKLLTERGQVADKAPVTILKDRVKELMDALLQGDGNENAGMDFNERLKKAVENTRGNFLSEKKEQEKNFDEKIFREVDNAIRRVNGMGNIEENLKDAEISRALNEQDFSGYDKGQSAEQCLMKDANIAIAGQDIPFQLPRRFKRWEEGYRESEWERLADYTTRNPGEAPPRKELPGNLKPFMRNADTAEAVRKLLSGPNPL